MFNATMFLGIKYTFKIAFYSFYLLAAQIFDDANLLLTSTLDTISLALTTAMENLSSFFAAYPSLVNVASAIRIILLTISNIIEHLFLLALLVVTPAVVFALIIFLYSLIIEIPVEHRFLRFVEASVQRELQALRLAARAAWKKVDNYKEAIDEVDDDNADLMRQIREEEHLLRKQGRRVEPSPARHHHPKLNGATFFLYGPGKFPYIAPQPSAWYLVRLLRGEEDPRVRAAKDDLYQAEGMLSNKLAVHRTLEKEWARLYARRSALYEMSLPRPQAHHFPLLDYSLSSPTSFANNNNDRCRCTSLYTCANARAHRAKKLSGLYML